MVMRSLNVASALELEGTKVCVEAGTTRQAYFMLFARKKSARCPQCR
jgi:hypothetical protein